MTWTHGLTYIGMAILAVAGAMTIAVLIVVPATELGGWLETIGYACMWGLVMLAAGLAFRRRPA